MRILSIVLSTLVFANISLLVYLFATKALNYCLEIRFGLFFIQHIFKYLVLCYTEVGKRKSYSKLIFLGLVASLFGFIMFTVA